jgi:hypothetical protein
MQCAGRDPCGGGELTDAKACQRTGGCELFSVVGAVTRHPIRIAAESGSSQMVTLASKTKFHCLTRDKNTYRE